MSNGLTQKLLGTGIQNRPASQTPTASVQVWKPSLWESRCVRSATPAKAELCSWRTGVAHLAFPCRNCRNRNSLIISIYFAPGLRQGITQQFDQEVLFSLYIVSLSLQRALRPTVQRTTKDLAWFMWIFCSEKVALEGSALSDRLKDTMRTGKASKSPHGPSPVVDHSPLCRDLRLREPKGHIQNYRAIQ